MLSRPAWLLSWQTATIPLNKPERLEGVGVPEVGQLSCRVVVFMNQAAEDITAAELLGDQRLRLAIAF